MPAPPSSVAGASLAGISLAFARLELPGRASAGVAAGMAAGAAAAEAAGESAVAAAWWRCSCCWWAGPCARGDCATGCRPAGAAAVVGR